MNKLKAKLAAALAGVLASAGAFAEGSSNAIDVTAATGALSDLKDAASTYFTSAVPFIVAIMGLGVVIVLLRVGYKLWQRFTNRAA